MARNGVVYPQPEAEVSFSRRDFFISLQSFSTVSHSCAAHRSQSEARILLRGKIQVTVKAKIELHSRRTWSKECLTLPYTAPLLQEPQPCRGDLVALESRLNFITWRKHIYHMEETGNPSVV